MLSPKQAAQPNPSSPALCLQDTTSPWSTDYGGNIFLLNLDTNARKEKMKNNFFNLKKKEKKNKIQEKEKERERKEEQDPI